MQIVKKKSWELKANDVTDERLFNNRRLFLKLGVAALVSDKMILDLLAKESDIIPTLKYKKDSNPDDLELTEYEKIASYNNFFEFTTDKEDVKDLVGSFNPSPWKVEIDGLVEKPMTLDLDDIMGFPLEERIYRFRCVEAWSMVVPWVGFPLHALIKKVKPMSSAKYLRFETLLDPEQFPDQKRGNFFGSLKYPYVEGLRMDEAMHDLTILAVGLYGKELPKQNGAPIRLVVPWKYGFKSIKSIVRISFTEKEPLNTWQAAASDEYGFYANVNPKVDHPRWSQKKERVLGKFFKERTRMFNGYEKEVASLYAGMDLRKFF